jgi:4-amino-4-deoxy-L-arabinose transferase-like glycosyltransferase
MTEGKDSVSTADRSPPNSRHRRLVYAAFALIIALQCLFALLGIDNFWQRGHNGFNGAAYHQAARNTLRHGTLFPAQYHTDREQAPAPKKLYTNAPLALHAHVVACLALFGDSELSVRLTPAIHGLLALLALLVIVRRRWGEGHAVMTGFVYVLLPINHTFANMVNHSTGFIFWSLVTLECYLRWIESPPADTGKGADGFAASGTPWLLGIFAAGFMAVSWDWPGYYVMFAIAVHWFYRSFDWPGEAPVASFGINRQHLLLFGFCAFVLLNFVGFFLLVDSLVGSYDKMFEAINARTARTTDLYQTLWTRTLMTVIGAPLIFPGLLWVAGFMVRHARGSARDRDLIPLSFLFAGALHLLIFKRTALIHVYWPWPLNPFLALSSASVVLWASGRVTAALGTLLSRPSGAGDGSGNARAAPVAGATLILLPFCWAYLGHTLPMIAPGRLFAGSLGYESYVSGYDEVLFAQRVRELTAPETVVAAHGGFKPSVQARATMDRTLTRTKKIRKRGEEVGEDGEWVVIGNANAVSKRELARFAMKHRFRQYGPYFLIDFRHRGQDLQAYGWVKTPASFRWKFFVNPFELPRKTIRDPEVEERLAMEMERIRRRAAKKRMRDGRRRSDG